MKVAIVLFAILVAGDAEAQQKPEPEKQDIQVTPEIAERCKQEGGCRLMSLRAFTNFVNEAQQKALQEGFRQGFQEGTQQGCRRGGSV